MSEQIVFGYAVAHKVTGERCPYTTRQVYDSKNAASGGLTRAKKAYSDYKRYNYEHAPDEYEVVPLVVGKLQ